MNNTKPTRSNVVLIKQMLNLIPREMLNRIAPPSGVMPVSETAAEDPTTASNIIDANTPGDAGFRMVPGE